MKVKKTFAALFTTVLSVAFILLVTVLVAAACSERVTLRFETGSGTHIASVEGRVGGDYSKPQEPSLDGYYFDGWFLDPSFSGEAQTLPDVMPSESTTYYAKYGKYPVLTLLGEGGTPERTELEVKPGENLGERLKNCSPQKEGLLFGGWARDGELLGADAVMGDGDMTLHARYKAAYSVDVYLQDADEPQRYRRDAALSFDGADWEGTAFGAHIPTPEHFRFEAGRSETEGVLQAGGKVFSLYFDREEFTVTLDPALPTGGEATEIRTRYGARLSLYRPTGGEGYEFLGWRGEEDHGAEEELILTGPLTLKGIWAVPYPNAMGEGRLCVEVGRERVRRAVCFMGDVAYEGEFREETGTFTAGPYRGKLESHGGLLPDDSGVYRGCDLTYTQREELGTLTLDFFGGTARYERGKEALSGTYEPLFDETEGRYTGEYAFGGEFRFRLSGSSFLREGSERGEYLAYDCPTGEFGQGTLALDGYGNARLCGEISQTGRYFSDGTQWRFVSEEGTESGFLLGGRKWTDGGTIAVENAFLLFCDELAGAYGSGEARLLLDGYGVRAVLHENGEETAAPFRRDGDVITLFSDPIRRFTLHGERFFPTSAEEGRYTGEYGILYLDGAGGASLGDGPSSAGRYTLSEDCYLYEGSLSFRFRLRGGEYDVYDAAKAGQFENYFYEKTLVLDGFGGGECYLTAGEGFPVRLLYRDERMLLLYSEAFHSPRKTAAFRIDDGCVVEIPSAEAGLYPVYENGERTEEMLLLDGMGGARLTVCGEAGGYTYSRKTGEAVCSFFGAPCSFLLTEKGGTACCMRSLSAGVYEGEAGTLVLDGYGNATFAEEDGVLPYLFRAGAAELDRGDRLLRFTLSPGSYTLVRYTRYRGGYGGGTLYLGEDSISAILRDGEDRYGTYGLDIFLSEGRSFRFRTEEGEFFIFDETQQGTFYTAEGDTLSLDGYGGATFTQGEEVCTGRAVLKDGLVCFSAETLPTRSGQIGFFVEGNFLSPLGEEFGRYTSEDGRALFLRGDGAAFFGGEWGTYAPIFEDVYEIFVHGARFCARLFEGGKWAEWHKTLSDRAGSYTAEGGELILDGCAIVLRGERMVSYHFVCACEEGFIARDPVSGGYFRFRFGERTSVTAVAPIFEVCTK